MVRAATARTIWVRRREVLPHHRTRSTGVARGHNEESDMADKADVTTYTLKQALAAKVEDHIEIAVEAEDGTKFKILSTADQLDALVGDLETILDEDDAEAEAAE